MLIARKAGAMFRERAVCRMRSLVKDGSTIEWLRKSPDAPIKTMIDKHVGLVDFIDEVVKHK